MATIVVSGTWTDQGIRNVKEAPKRIQGAHELAKKMGIDFKLYLTSGESDNRCIVQNRAENRPEALPSAGVDITLLPLGVFGREPVLGETLGHKHPTHPDIGRRADNCVVQGALHIFHAETLQLFNPAIPLLL
jgi:uncharacterized protein with GYD domain